MVDAYVLDGPTRTAWWEALVHLDAALRARDVARVGAAYAACLRSLVAEGSDTLADACADALLFADGPWADHVARSVRAERDPLDAAGVRAALESDVAAYAAVVGRAWTREVADGLGRQVPPLDALGLAGRAAGAGARACDRLAAALAAGDRTRAVEVVLHAARSIGAGPLARDAAFRWDGTRLVGVGTPDAARHDALVGLERQLEPLVANVEAFLDGRPALATLLYGPRGSGKSTAVRGLLERYAERGLRLIEVPTEHVGQLARVLADASALPSPVVMMLDDLAFDDGDARVRPLKSVLEGGLTPAGARVLVVATTNRRHLVRERTSDRPDPLDADVHAWDTHHDRLALADRFGLTITFPSADRRAYLAIVAALAERAGLPADGERASRALAFAAWGNGLSGRTARQFVDRERAGSEPTPER